jgi:hypothetical protein
MSTENENPASCQTAVIRSFIEQELQQAKHHKTTYGWICKHFKNYYEGRISVCENLLMFIDTEVKIADNTEIGACSD